MKRIVFAVGVIALTLASQAAPAASPDERIRALEQQIAALQRTYTTNASDTVSAVESMKGAQDEMTSMKGQVEATSRILQAQREELMQLIQDLQARVTTLEERMGGFAAQGGSATGRVNQAAGAEGAAYQQGLDQLNGGRFLESASAFEGFLQQYPKSQFAPSARFMVAESFYLSRDYKRAIKEYQVYLEKYPKDAKVAEAILKQGNSFFELGMMEEARAFYEKVATSYPKSKEAQAARTKIARIDEKKKGGAAKGQPQTGVPSEGAAGSPLATYPTETIEQQRAKMSGKPLPPVQPAPPAKTPTISKPRVGPAAKEF